MECGRFENVISTTTEGKSFLFLLLEAILIFRYCLRVSKNILQTFLILYYFPSSDYYCCFLVRLTENFILCLMFSYASINNICMIFMIHQESNSENLVGARKKKKMFKLSLSRKERLEVEIIICCIYYDDENGVDLRL
ncbi:hypothetical protein ACKWTF_016000 [Chironomus riparius]